MCRFFSFFRAGLSLGASKHWSETLEILTGSKQVSAEALLEYFSPLHKFLKEENEKTSSPDRTTVSLIE